MLGYGEQNSFVEFRDIEFALG